MPETTFDPVPVISDELQLPRNAVAAVVKLFADGNTVPFIARYRKEATGGLDEVAIRGIEERFQYLGELDDRRRAITTSIDEQGKLTDELRAALEACTTKAALEDLYLPYKPKRRTRATIAREKGLEPLAERILAQPGDGDPEKEAASFVDADKGVESIEDALAGAGDIVAEALAETASIREFARDAFAREGVLLTKAVPDKTEEPTKFETYYDYREPIAAMPSHRYLAIRRGEREGVLRVTVELEPESVVGRIEREAGYDESSPFAPQLRKAADDAFRRLIAPAVTNDVRAEAKVRSDESAVEVFAENLRHLLLAAPLGGRTVIGVDPGLRTGCKCAVVDASGKFVEHRTVYLTRGAQATQSAEEDLVELVQAHRPFAIAVGNGTGGREAEAFARRAMKRAGLEVIVAQVNESGASIYSASDLAREEFPDLDLTVRGAISIARRLQDPLAELVKIDPKSIGVGQYQHDVHPSLLKRKLGDVVESCVHHVGVELTTASAPLLGRVSGIGPKLATQIVKHRESSDGFSSRADLLSVSGLGPKAFEQAAGFLRLREGSHPLDASAVHPERYELVERMASDRGIALADLVGNASVVDAIDIGQYVDDTVGELTLRDIVDELKKPGRDPRDTFEPPQFRDDVTVPEDLEPGMELEGVVTNVTDFGAFVDIGVHQDGLVHISQLADRFVKSPSDVVKAGDRIKVRVLEVDLERRRISLTAKKAAAAGEGQAKRGGKKPTAAASRGAGSSRRSGSAPGNAKGKGKRKGKPPAERGGGRKDEARQNEGSYADKLAALQKKFNRP